METTTKNAKALPAILTTAAITLSMANLTYASHQHAGAECYHNGHREYKIFPNLAMPDEDNQNHQEHMAFDQMTVGDLK
jgi:hypothetical protein